MLIDSNAPMTHIISWRELMNMSTTRTIAALTLFCAVGMGLSVAAYAQDKDTKKINAYEELVRANRFASAGALSRSIPHYINALKADPVNYGVAHYNLAEVYKSKRKCDLAGFHYQAYILSSRDEATKVLAREGLNACNKSKWKTLSVLPSPKNAQVLLNGFLFSSGELSGVVLPPGEYELQTRLADHKSNTQKVVMGDDPIKVNVSLEKFTFYGSLGFKVQHRGKVIEGASVKVLAKSVDKADVKVDPLAVTMPSSKKFKLPTGKYFIEVNAEGYDRWIRNVYVTRDSDNLVLISMKQSLPEEIR